MVNIEPEYYCWWMLNELSRMDYNFYAKNILKHVTKSTYIQFVCDYATNGTLMQYYKMKNYAMVCTVEGQDM